MKENFSSDLGGKALPYFADWLIENVHQVEITAYSDAIKSWLRSQPAQTFRERGKRSFTLWSTERRRGFLEGFRRS